MTKSMSSNYPYNVINYPSIGADIETSKGGFIFNQLGIDNIELIAKYDTFKNMVEKMGLTLTLKPMPKEEKQKKGVFKRIAYEMKQDSKKRLLSDKFMPIVEVINLPTVDKSKPLYITVIRNTPTLFDIATHHKKAKDSFCLILFAGLHQPSRKISSEAMKIISKIIKRKAFTLRSVDLAIDTTDKRSITHNQKGAFKDDLMPYSDKGVISKGSSFFINNIEHPTISRILYYDKYFKQTKYLYRVRVKRGLS